MAVAASRSRSGKNQTASRTRILAACRLGKQESRAVMRNRIDASALGTRSELELELGGMIR